jgi:hypothetical protein
MLFFHFVKKMIINTEGEAITSLRSKLVSESQKEIELDRTDELNRLKSEDILLFNQSAEEYFLEILCECLDEFGGKITQSEAINKTAFRLNVSVVTTKRYFSKHSTKRGRFELKRGLVICKIHFHPRRENSL